MADAIYRMDFGHDELFPETTWVNRPGSGVLLGPLRHPMGMYQHLSDGTGFDPTWERPIYSFDVSNGATPNDVELSNRGGSWLVSRRAMELLTLLDPNAAAFLPVTTRIRDSEGDREGPEYFLCDVVRFVDALDEGRSRVRIREEAGNRSVRIEYDDSLGYDGNVFRRGAIGSAKIFRLMFAPSIIACTDAVRLSWLRAGLTNNLVFERLGQIDD